MVEGRLSQFGVVATGIDWTNSSACFNPGLSFREPDIVSEKILSQAAAVSASICKSIDWLSWEIHAYPTSIIPLWLSKLIEVDQKSCWKIERGF
jgi:hypothetical protein